MNPVVIVGAGPAGASLAYLLARNGVPVTLLERRRDFAREFRGEILMPSGMDAFEQMGLLDDLLGLPGHVPQNLTLYMNTQPVLSVDLTATGVPDNVRFMAVSQVALLEMLVAKADVFENFQFMRGAAIRGLQHDEAGRLNGVRIHMDDEERELPASLVIGADGRNSVVRREAGFGLSHAAPPLDIVWIKLPCPQDWLGVRAYAGRGHLLVAYRTWGDGLQLGWVILKGTFKALRDAGLDAWVDEMCNQVTDDLAEHIRAHRHAIERPFLLDVVSDRVESWWAPGIMVIGDAAHAMSPVGGQGINIALRDAVVAANHLVPLLQSERQCRSGPGCSACRDRGRAAARGAVHPEPAGTTAEVDAGAQLVGGADTAPGRAPDSKTPRSATRFGSGRVLPARRYRGQSGSLTRCL